MNFANCFHFHMHNINANRFLLNSWKIIVNNEWKISCILHRMPRHTHEPTVRRCYSSELQSWDNLMFSIKITSSHSKMDCEIFPMLSYYSKLNAINILIYISDNHYIEISNERLIKIREMEQKAAKLPQKDQNEAFQRLNQLKKDENKFRKLLDERKTYDETNERFRSVKIDNW